MFQQNDFGNKSNGREEKNQKRGAFKKVVEGGGGHTQIKNGAFKFEDNIQYEARFKIYDFCGNTTDIFSEWIQLGNPMIDK